MVDSINERFRRKPDAAVWSADGALADAGLLVHIFDGWEDYNFGSKPSAGHTEMSTSLIFADQHPKCCPQHKIPMFTSWATGKQGMIFRPGGSTRILCGNSRDSNYGLCRDRCASVPLDADDGFDPSREPLKCSWNPEDFAVFLRRTNAFETQTQAPTRTIDYNEIIVDSEHWTLELPATIEAFFRSDDHGRGRKDDDVAQKQHQKFLQKYGLSRAEVPLLEFDPSDWESPFREVPVRL